MNVIRKTATIIAIGVVPICLLAGVVFGLRWGCNRVIDSTTGFDRKNDRGYRSLRVGMPQGQVFAKMGAPIWTNTLFTLGQYDGNEKEYAKTNGVTAVVFYTWANGVDWFYCVGFDNKGQMVMKGQGGT